MATATTPATKRRYAVRWLGSTRIVGPCVGPTEAAYKAFQCLNDTMRVKVLSGNPKGDDRAAADPSGWVQVRPVVAKKDLSCGRCLRPIPEGAAMVLADHFTHPDLIGKRDAAAWLHPDCEAADGAPVVVPDPYLEHWSHLVEEVQVLADLFPALATGRPELMILAKPRAMTAEETAAVQKLVRVLLETNQSLQEQCRGIYDRAAEINRQAAILRDAARTLGVECDCLVTAGRWGQAAEGE